MTHGTCSPHTLKKNSHPPTLLDTWGRGWANLLNLEEELMMKTGRLLKKVKEALLPLPIFPLIIKL